VGNRNPAPRGWHAPIARAIDRGPASSQELIVVRVNGDLDADTAPALTPFARAPALHCEASHFTVRGVHGITRLVLASPARAES
jgi:hypothetical protein